MKQLVIGLLIALTLTGCSRFDAQHHFSTTNQMSGIGSHQTFYQPDSPVERATAGAVHVYDMDKPISGIAIVDGNLLICTEDTYLSLLDGKTLEVLKERSLDTKVNWGSSSMQISDQQIGYYDPRINAFTILNSELIAESTLEIPEEPSAVPIISSDFKTVYYPVDNGIQAMNMTTGTSRILRQEYTPILSLENMMFSNDVLHYTREASGGIVQNCFISAEDGSLVQTSFYETDLIQWGDQYAGIATLHHPLGKFQRILTGVREESPKMLIPATPWAQAFFPGNGQVVTQLENQIGLTLNSFDLETGEKTAEIILPQIHEFFDGGCIEGSYLWMWNRNESRFYCWNMSLSLPRENIAVLEEFRSLDTPSESVLAGLMSTISSMENQYGIDISFTEKSNRTAGFNYANTPDYRPDFYQQALTHLNMVLQQMPSGFMDQVGKRTNSGNTHINLIDDYDPALGPRQGTGSTEFTDGGVVLNLSICADIEKLFYLQLGYAIDARIASMSEEMESWSSLNPKGFSYSGQVDKDTPYLTEKHNYFVDYASMESPRNDRAHIFLYAMLPNQEGQFISSHIQAKLTMLCRLIREIYELSPEAVLPWEQYLLT